MNATLPRVAEPEEVEGYWQSRDTLARDKGICVHHVKLSIKVPPVGLKRVVRRCARHEIPITYHTNFIIFKDSGFTFSVFKPKRGTFAEQHVNVCGVTQFSQVPRVTKILAKYIKCDVRMLYPIVDNISATFNLRQRVNLLEFMRSNGDVQFRFHVERFAGLHYRHYNATGVLFSSGQLVIIGAKRLRHICELINDVFRRLPPTHGRRARGVCEE